MGLPVLDGALLKNAALPRLRVWFNDGTRGWQKAGDDVSLAAALGLPGDGGNTALNTGQADSILRELRDLRAKLDRPSATPPAHEHPEAAEPKFVTVSLGISPSLGRADAPLVLVEFTDYQCGFCKRFHEGVMPELIKNYVETGRLRIVSRNLALSFHENAEPAAQAALCAHQQQKFWPMREKLFANTAMLTSANLMKAAEELKLDMTAFRLCVGGKTFASQIAKDGQEAGAAGINGTPTFVLGKPTGDKVTGLLIVGARPYAAFDAEMQKMLPPAK